MSDFLEVAIKAVKAAEAVILDYYQKPRYETKADRTPVTLADTGAERVIRETISRIYPDHAFVGEEYGSNVQSEEYRWIIDPIDGTKNYVRHLPYFGTQLALMKGDQIILGVSNAPALKELIWAERGSGVYLNQKKLKVSKIKSLSEAYLGFGGLKYFYLKNKDQGLKKLLNQVWGARGFGDFWAYTLLARGKLDINLEANTYIWDVAAQSVIIEEAGGKVTEIDGRPLSLASMSCLATNGRLHEEVAAYFQK